MYHEMELVKSPLKEVTDPGWKLIPKSPQLASNAQLAEKRTGVLT